jgi:hypothetical protein
MPALSNLPGGVGAKSGELGSILPSISPTYPISFCPWFRRLGDRETSRVIEKLEIRLSMGFAIIHPRILCHCVKLQTTPKRQSAQVPFGHGEPQEMMLHNVPLFAQIQYY